MDGALSLNRPVSNYFESGLAPGTPSKSAFAALIFVHWLDNKLKDLSSMTNAIQDSASLGPETRVSRRGWDHYCPLHGNLSIPGDTVGVGTNRSLHPRTEGVKFSDASEIIRL